MTKSQKILDLIDQYVEPDKDGNVLVLNMAHENVFGENPDFETFADAREEYRNRSWDEMEFKRFVAETKRAIEANQSMLPETYFIITKPQNPSLKTIKKQLDERRYDPTKTGEERAGFQYREVDDEINGRYIYVDVDTSASYSGEVNHPVTESAVEFRIIPRRNLLIIESTSVVKVQKSKSIFRDKTGLDIQVAGDLTLYGHEDAANRVRKFRESFESRDSENQDKPAIVQVHDLKLERDLAQENSADKDDDNEPTMELTDIDFEGTDIADHPKVQSEIEDGWTIKRLSASIRYKMELMDVTIAGTSMMGYGKIDNFTSRQKAEELKEQVRDRYLTYIAHANEDTSHE